MATFSKKKVVLTVAVLEVATLLFAGHRGSLLLGASPLPRTFVPVETVFPGARAPQFLQQLPMPVATPAARRPAPDKPDPKAVIETRIFEHAPQRVM